jgi:hypothetical protein
VNGFEEFKEVLENKGGFVLRIGMVQLKRRRTNAKAFHDKCENSNT